MNSGLLINAAMHFLTSRCQCLSEQNLFSFPQILSEYCVLRIGGRFNFSTHDEGQGLGISVANPKSVNRDYNITVFMLF